MHNQELIEYEQKKHHELYGLYIHCIDDNQRIHRIDNNRIVRSRPSCILKGID